MAVLDNCTMCNLRCFLLSPGRVKRFFLFFRISTPSLWPTQPATEGEEKFFAGIKPPGLDINRFSPSRA
jgi:hypothetical protein